MGYDANIYIPKGNTKKEVEEQLILLGYEKIYSSTFYRGNTKNDFQHETGVYAFLKEINDDKNKFSIWIRTQIFANSYDLEFQNRTLKHFKKYFNTYFISDNGKNRYFVYDKSLFLTSPENGCYLAILNLHNKFVSLMYTIKKYPEDNEGELILLENGIPSPSVLNANVYLSFLCSLVEQYFKETYVVLLTYSKRKEEILKNGNKLSYYDLCDISDGKLTVERAFANGLSFQNMYKICYNYKNLDKTLDLNSILKKPYKRRKESLFDSINRILEQRHSMIHRIEYDLDYNSANLINDIENVKEIIRRTYKYICEKNNWKEQEVMI